MNAGLLCNIVTSFTVISIRSGDQNTMPANARDFMMKLAQCKIRWLARLMLVLVLFAHGIVAASACVMSSPAQAYSMELHEDEPMPCHEEELPNVNACLSHCVQADQISLDQHSATIAAPASRITWLTPFPQIQPDHPKATYDHVAPDTGPPIPIRFCSLLN